MPVVVRVLGMANGLSIGPQDGWFIKHVDIQAIPDIHWLQLTPNLNLAKEWPSAGEVFELYREVLKKDPVRIDGKPNRPLTAFNIVIEEILYEGGKRIHQMI
jgi:hypothetical protein